MKKLTNTEVELKRSVAYKKRVNSTQAVSKAEKLNLPALIFVIATRGIFRLLSNIYDRDFGENS